jgi:hypothetical protein
MTPFAAAYGDGEHKVVQSPEGGDTKELKYRCWIVIAPVRRGAREPVPRNRGGIIFTQIITEKTR